MTDVPPPPGGLALDADALPHRWDLSVAEAREVQLRLRERLVLRAPDGFAPRTFGGADVSMEKFAKQGYAGIVVLDAATLATVDQSGAAADLPMPYVPGYLSFRELPALAAAWAGLRTRPDVLLFDGQGIAHPRRFGVACHGGLLFGVPSIGVAKSILVGTHGPLGHERGATAELVDRGETVGMAVRTRAGVTPVYVSPGHRMDLATAVAVVLAAAPTFREPETTRRSHRLVNDLRRAAGAAPDG
ncbi:MAG: endonuclease [Gemmatimonadetes bacterium]|nr:endonuclease [Gemmatimonadota bacterium]